jgi:hypothetical protein
MFFMSLREIQRMESNVDIIENDRIALVSRPTTARNKMPIINVFNDRDAALTYLADVLVNAYLAQRRTT